MMSEEVTQENEGTAAEEEQECGDFDLDVPLDAYTEDEITMLNKWADKFQDLMCCRRIERQWSPV